MKQHCLEVMFLVCCCILDCFSGVKMTCFPAVLWVLRWLMRPPWELYNLTFILGLLLLLVTLGMNDDLLSSHFLGSEVTIGTLDPSVNGTGGGWQVGKGWDVFHLLCTHGFQCAPDVLYRGSQYHSEWCFLKHGHGWKIFRSLCCCISRKPGAFFLCTWQSPSMTAPLITLTLPLQGWPALPIPYFQYV